MIAEDALIEHACYVGNYYGTPKRYVMEQLEAGKNVILEIEIQGALKVKERFPDTLLLFVTPPSARELERRLRGRGTETDEVIKSRLKRAVEEAEFMDRYDYILVNDDLETCVQEMHEFDPGAAPQNFPESGVYRGNERGFKTVLNEAVFIIKLLYKIKRYPQKGVLLCYIHPIQI